MLMLIAAHIIALTGVIAVSGHFIRQDERIARANIPAEYLAMQAGHDAWMSRQLLLDKIRREIRKVENERG